MRKIATISFLTCLLQNVVQNASYLCHQHSRSLVDSRISSLNDNLTDKLLVKTQDHFRDRARLKQKPLHALKTDDSAILKARQYGANGKEITDSCVVRVAVAGLKAYHVQSKGYGSFDIESKKFMISPEFSRERRCLILPVGLRGEVQRIYDVDDLDAIHPILVRFTPGKFLDVEGFDTPVPFLMHFDSSEVETVD